jgi:hypothetical protein
MGYAILRTQKLKSPQAVRRSLLHAFREQDTPNADPAKTPENGHTGATNTAEALERFNARLPDKVRKNAVLAIEYLITASPEDMKGKTRAEQDAYFADALTWLKVRHGAENIVYAGIHRDETTPHMTAFVVPLDERGKLNCRSFLGGANALSEMQSDFAKRVGQQHGLQRGIEGSKARHTTIQAYYARASEAFSELPKVTTPAPAKLRPEPDKPGMFASSAAMEAYRADHDKWERERAAADRQQRQRQAEVKAQRDAAIATARRNEAQAAEAAALQRKLDEQKRSTGNYVKKAAKLEVELAAVKGVASLFTPEEVKAAQQRKQQQDAEKARKLQEARQKAADEAQRAEVAAEVQRRVTELPELRKRAGTAYTFSIKAAEAIKQAGGHPGNVDWRAVEAATVREAIVVNGQTPQSVADVITRHSPGCADPKQQDAIRAEIHQLAPKLQQLHQVQQAQTQSGPKLGH